MRYWERVFAPLFKKGWATSMGRMAIVASMAGFLCAACAFDLAHVTYTAATFEPTQYATRTVVLSKNVTLTGTPCSNSRTLRKTTRWEQVGTIAEGDVFRSKEQVLTLECSNVHEAYMVMSEDKLIGFFLPFEKGFVPHSPPIALPVER
jgi:hypothetical protein